MADLSRPMDADALTEPLVFCVVTGGEGGWFHCEVRVVAPTAAAAVIAAQSFLDKQFVGMKKAVRTVPWSEESRDFERGIRVVRGGCRYSFRLEEGETTQPPAGGEVRYMPA